MDYDETDVIRDIQGMNGYDLMDKVVSMHYSKRSIKHMAKEFVLHIIDSHFDTGVYFKVSSYKKHPYDQIKLT